MKLVWLFLALLLGAALISASPTRVNIGGPGGVGAVGGQGDGMGSGAFGPSDPISGPSGWKAAVRPAVDQALAGAASRSKFADRRLLQQHGPESWEWEGGASTTWRDTVGIKAGVKGGVVGKPAPAQQADSRFTRTASGGE